MMKRLSPSPHIAIGVTGDVALDALLLGPGPWLDALKDDARTAIVLSSVCVTVRAIWGAAEHRLWIQLLEQFLARHGDPGYARHYVFYAAQHCRYFKHHADMNAIIRRIMPPGEGTDSALFFFTARVDDDIFDAGDEQKVVCRGYASLMKLYEKSQPLHYDEEYEYAMLVYSDSYTVVPYERCNAVRARRVDVVVRFFELYNELLGRVACADHTSHFLELPSDCRSKFHGLLYLLHSTQCTHFDEMHYSLTFPVQSYYDDGDGTRYYTNNQEITVLIEQTCYERLRDEIHALRCMLCDILCDIEGLEGAPAPPCLIDLAPYREQFYHPVHGRYNTSVKQKRLLLSELQDDGQ